MHHHCLSCSADLGTNDVVEAWPIGRRLAFDPWRGRLWVVCPRCRRWNLTPIEERWEPVEALEKLFRDSRLRVHSENIGLAKLPDGSTLVRVGQALEGELAAWRYGRELQRRRWKGLALGASLAAVFTGVAVGGVGGFAMVGIPAGLGNVALQAITHTVNVRRRRRVICRLDAEDSPTGQPLLVRRLHLDGAVLSHDDAGAPLLWTPTLTALDLRVGWQRALGPQPLKLWQLARGPIPALKGDVAVRAMTRAMIETNNMGGTAGQIAEALKLLERAGGADAFIRGLASRDPLLAPKRKAFAAQGPSARPRIGERARASGLPPAIVKHAVDGSFAGGLHRIEALALEMALHDERERQALEGELASLEDEWKEAEMLARIADTLPEEPESAAQVVLARTDTSRAG